MSLDQLSTGHSARQVEVHKPGKESKIVGGKWLKLEWVINLII